MSSRRFAGSSEGCPRTAGPALASSCGRATRPSWSGSVAATSSPGRSSSRAAPRRPFDTAASPRSSAGCPGPRSTCSRRGSGARSGIVELARPAWVEPRPCFRRGRRQAVRPLVDTYGALRYADVDPTPFAAISFVVMFGMMFGDVGQGLLLAGLGAALSRAGTGGWRRSATSGRFRGRGLAAAFFGLLYGEFFGPTGSSRRSGSSPRRIRSSCSLRQSRSGRAARDLIRDRHRGTGGARAAALRRSPRPRVAGLLIFLGSASRPAAGTRTRQHSGSSAGRWRSWARYSSGLLPGRGAGPRPPPRRPWRSLTRSSAWSRT